MRVRVWTIALMAGVGAALGLSATPAAQAQSYRAPRSADGKPNLNGIWQAMNDANWDIEAHGPKPAPISTLGVISAVPPALGVVEGGEIPYQSWALEKRKENFDKRMTEDPENKCYLPGVPRATYMPQPFQIVQSQKLIMILHQYAGAVRTIFMEDHKEAPVDSWMGWSNGKWEGDTLVIDTTGFNGQAWLDRAGNFHSDALHVVERFTATSPYHLDYEVTIDDPKVFTRPWKIQMPLYRRIEKDAQVLEFKCVEFSEDLIYGHLRKQPIK